MNFYFLNTCFIPAYLCFIQDQHIHYSSVDMIIIFNEQIHNITRSHEFLFTIIRFLAKLKSSQGRETIRISFFHQSKVGQAISAFSSITCVIGRKFVCWLFDIFITKLNRFFFSKNLQKPQVINFLFYYVGNY